MTVENCGLFPWWLMFDTLKKLCFLLNPKQLKSSFQVEAAERLQLNNKLLNLIVEDVWMWFTGLNWKVSGTVTASLNTPEVHIELISCVCLPSAKFFPSVWDWQQVCVFNLRGDVNAVLRVRRAAATDITRRGKGGLVANPQFTSGRGLTRKHLALARFGGVCVCLNRWLRGCKRWQVCSPMRLSSCAAPPVRCTINHSHMQLISGGDLQFLRGESSDRGIIQSCSHKFMRRWTVAVID